MTDPASPRTATNVEFDDVDVRRARLEQRGGPPADVAPASPRTAESREPEMTFGMRYDPYSNVWRPTTPGTAKEVADFMEARKNGPDPASPRTAESLKTDHFHDPFDPVRHTDWLTTLGHRPLPDGRCEHRWRNRTTRAVRCSFLDGFRAALAAPLPDDERLRAALERDPGKAADLLQSALDWVEHGDFYAAAHALRALAPHPSEPQEP